MTFAAPVVPAGRLAGTNSGVGSEVVLGAAGAPAKEALTKKNQNRITKLVLPKFEVRYRIFTTVI
jgi:hypothetical protein